MKEVIIRGKNPYPECSKSFLKDPLESKTIDVK
jgi:hypothetical protein